MELHQHFNQRVEAETITPLPQHPLSEAIINKTQRYRIVFSTLSALLMLLTLFVLRANAVELDASTYGYGSSIQMGIALFAAFSSMICLHIARILRPEREAARELYHDFKRSLEIHYQTEIAAWKYAFWRCPSDAYRDATSLHSDHRRKLIEGTRLYYHAKQIFNDADSNTHLNHLVRKQIYRDTLTSLQEALIKLV